MGVLTSYERNSSLQIFEFVKNRISFVIGQMIISVIEEVEYKYKRLMNVNINI